MISQTDVRTFYELQPVVPLSQWWHFLVLLAVVLALGSFAIWMCIRDSRRLPRGITILLSVMRVTAIACIILYVLNPGKRSETRLVKTSRLAVVVDTSLSMGLRDQQLNAESNDQSDGPRRIDEVIRWVSNKSEIDSLRQQHDVTIYRFGERAQPEIVANLPKNGPAIAGPALSSSEQKLESIQEALADSRRRGWIAFAIFAIGLVVLGGWIWAWVMARTKEVRAAWLCGSLICFVFGIVALA